MARFDGQSRYTKYATTYQTQDGRGREVSAMTAARVPRMRNRGTHLSKDGQRLDHLSWHYLKNPTKHWALVSHNQRILPDAVLFQYRIRIPIVED